MNALQNNSTLGGHIRVGAASINTTILAWEKNKAHILKAIELAREQNITVLALGELCISGYGLEDTALRWDVSFKANAILQEIAPQTKGMIVTVGLPVMFQAKVWNCVATLVDGKIAAVSAKKRLASGTLFYEGRVYGQWPDGKIATLGPEFDNCYIGDFVLNVGGIRIATQTCEEAWVYEATVADALKRGADIVLNNSASPGAPNKDMTRTFIDQVSAAGNVAYVYANLVGSEAGGVVNDGDCRISNCGDTVARMKRYSMKDVRVIGATVPVRANRCGRARMKYHQPACSEDGVIAVAFDWPALPRVSIDPSGDLYTEHRAHDALDLEGIFDAMTLGFYDYWRKVKVAKGFVVGCSGGYDSTLVIFEVLATLCRGIRELGAEFVSQLSFVPGIIDLGLDPFRIMHQIMRAYSLSTENNPEQTISGASLVGKASRANFKEHAVQEAFAQSKKDLAAMIGHDLSWEVKSESLALESAQTRCRGSLLATVAVALDFMMLNTGNMVEMALGYCTQGADMNGGWGPIEGLPKTVIGELLAHIQRGAIKLPAHMYAEQERFDRDVDEALRWIIKTPPSAGLQPQQQNQTDEGALGPFEVQEFIHDAFIIGTRSVPELCQATWEKFGPHSTHANKRYTEKDIRNWILIFLYRWSGSQWKRYCAPQGQRLWGFSLMTQTDVRWPVVADISFWTDAVQAYRFNCH